MDSRPLPEGQDLAELRHRAEVAEAAAALMAEQRDNALLRLETAERGRDELSQAEQAAHRNWKHETDRLQAQLARAREAFENIRDNSNGWQRDTANDFLLSFPINQEG